MLFNLYDMTMRVTWDSERVPYWWACTSRHTYTHTQGSHTQAAPGAPPSGITLSASPCSGVTGFSFPAAGARLLATTAVVTGRTGPVAPRAVPAGLAGRTRSVCGAARLALSAVPTAGRRENGGVVGAKHHGTIKGYVSEPDIQ